LRGEYIDSEDRLKGIRKIVLREIFLFYTFSFKDPNFLPGGIFLDD
jgi:hypothetical protein